MPEHRIAFLVGIDDYGDPRIDLRGCVSNAEELAKVISTNDAAPEANFHTTAWTSRSHDITRGRLRTELINFFGLARPHSQVLFYFAGHGMETPLGPELVTPDFKKNPLGVSMNDLAYLANNCGARQVTLILDCCHSGALGNMEELQDAKVAPTFRIGRALISEGVQIALACRRKEKAAEIDKDGLFTRLLIEGLLGAAADTLGHVTLSALHNYATGAFGPFDQAPVFKSYANESLPLRQCRPRVRLQILQKLTTYFPARENAAQPTGLKCKKTWDDDGERVPYEAATPGQQTYYDLQVYRDAGMLRLPAGQTLWHCIDQELEVELNELGRHFWHRVNNKHV